MWKLVLILCVTCRCIAQQPVGPPPANCNIPPHEPLVAGPNMPQIAVDRENALAPAYAASACHDYEGALRLFIQVANKLPKDGRVLMLTGEAAMRAGHLEEAVPYLEGSIKGNRYSWGVRADLMQVFLALGRWEDVEALRSDTREAALSGDNTLSATNGYRIEQLKTDGGVIQVTEYATLYGETHVRDRLTLSMRKNQCTGFTPYFDLQSSGSGEFSLVLYQDANSHELIKTYPGKEPSYRVVRDDVLSSLEQQKPTDVAAQSCSGGR